MTPLLLLAAAVTVGSPDGRVRVTVEGASYRAEMDGRPLMLKSGLGIEGWDADLAQAKVSRRVVRRTWKPLYGERAEIPDRYNELTLSAKTLSVVVRAYDEGFAFRYRLEGTGAFRFEGEKTGFRLPEGAHGYEEHGTEGEYAFVPVGQIKEKCERPLTVDLRDGRFVSLGEAALVDYPRMLLGPDGQGGLRAQLDGPVEGKLPFETPWRVFVVGRRAGDLLEKNYLALNLNAPQAFAGASWIKPGKVIREVTLSTAGGKRCVDFAAKHGLDYVEYDAGWYGHEYDDASDARQVAPDPKRIANIKDHGGLDLQEVIRYAKARGVEVILYVNRRALERQLDEILLLYRGWGVAGVKFGFVQVGPQKWSAWLHEAIRKAAANRLMVDVHDSYRPTGYTRTYPNLMTVEGVRGNEHMPTSRHNATLPFTRAVAGSYDYTICWNTPRLKATRAHQMAQSVIHYSPWIFLYWYDRPEEIVEEPALEFFKALPAVWDETRVLEGKIGETAVVARRKGRDWFLGGITNEEARTIETPLGFLGTGRARMDLYCDGDEARKVTVGSSEVAGGDRLQLKMAANGGCSARFTPLPR